MATTQSTIEYAIRSAHQITQGILGDLSDPDLLVRPTPGANHIAWQLGHIICSERKFLVALGHSPTPLPNGFEASYAKDRAASDDAKAFHSKQTYLDLLGKLHDDAVRALNATPAADLDKPGPEQMRAYAPTIGAVYHLIGLHVYMHSGQWSVVRRKLGKPVVF